MLVLEVGPSVSFSVPHHSPALPLTIARSNSSFVAEIKAGARILKIMAPTEILGRGLKPD